MPRWEATTLEDRSVRDELRGSTAYVRVHPMPDEKLTLVYLAMVVEGTDAATIDRCQRRAEQLLSEAQRGVRIR